MLDAEDGALGSVGEAFDFPAVGEDNLLHDGEAEAGSGWLSGEVGFENLDALRRGNAGAIVANLEEGFGGAETVGDDLDLAVWLDGLDGVEQEVEEGLAEQLFVGFDGELGFGGVQNRPVCLRCRSPGRERLPRRRNRATGRCGGLRADGSN